MALLETMIGLTLGLLAVLVIVKSFASIEQFARSGAAQADAQQRGALVSWRLVREIRMAGAGLGHSATAWGCRLNVWRAGMRLLPRATAWPAPFANLPTTLLLTPLAASDQTGPGATDQLIFASARGSSGTAPLTSSVISAAMIESGSTTGYRAGDLLLMTNATAVGDCQLGQVDSRYAPPAAGAPAATAIPTGPDGTLYNGPAGFGNLAQPADYTVLNLGSTPSLQFVGVNAMSQLVLLDALGMMTGAEPVVLAEQVRQFQVLYGLDDGIGGGVANDNVIDRWAAPSGPWQFDTVHSAVTPALQVKAVRIAIVVRAGSPQGRLGPESLTLFGDLPAALQVVVPLTAAERLDQFQVYDTVIAVRNGAAALCSEPRRAAAVPAPSICD
jgi:type IV pilus assembly protein PilW